MSSVCDSVVRDIGPDQMSPLPLLPLRHLANLSRAARRRAYLGASRPEMGKREREKERDRRIEDVAVEDMPDVVHIRSPSCLPSIPDGVR